MKKLLIIWGNWGPYHYARFDALHEQAKKRGIEAHGLELFPSSGVYEWRSSIDHSSVHHLNLGKIETEFNLRLLITRFLPFLCKLRPDVILVPSYWHWSLFINMSGRFLGAKIVMMNESHAGTEKARGWKRGIKRAIVRRFHAALVGGSPHRRHFADLGLDKALIHLGYDAIDNGYFTSQSQAARANRQASREKLGLPQNYFLSLGRMVKKKNLKLLIEAYALLMERMPALSHDIVLVGSGEERDELRALCHHLGLTVVDHTRHEPRNRVVAAGKTLAAAGERSDYRLSNETSSTEIHQPTVHFYGFRQIDENPIFYALASAFILPSSREEWGLVVNEAMASGLPVIVSRKAGCAEDLVVEGRNGFAIDPESADELSYALAKFADPALAASMGSQSLEIVRDWGCLRFASGALDASFTALNKVACPAAN